MRSKYRLGVDAGGTFTDFVLADAEGGMRLYKTPSTPQDPTAAIANGLALMSEDLGEPIPEIVTNCDLCINGTTVALNALLQHKGVKVGLICTAGHEDSQEIRLGHKEDGYRYDHEYPPATQLVPRHLRCGIRERIISNGTVRTPLNEQDVRDAVERFKKEGVVVIGNGGAFPPFEYVEDGKLVGYDIDLGEELAKRMGVKAKWTKIEFRGIIAGLVSKRVDMLVTAMAYTPERAERLTFSEPYFMTGVAAAYKPEMKVTSAADLAGKKIGVQIGTSGERYVRKNLADKVAAIQTYDEFLLAIRDLEAGRVDAVVNTGPTIAFNVKQRGNKLGVTANFDSRIIGVNTRKDDAALLAEVNKHILDMKKEGFLEKLDVKWFGRKMAHSPSS